MGTIRIICETSKHASDNSVIDWNSIWPAIIALVGVCLTIWVNARSSRKAIENGNEQARQAFERADVQNRKVFELTAERARQDKAETNAAGISSLRASILAVASRLRDSVEGEIRWLIDNDSTYIILLDYFEIFRINMSRIGDFLPSESGAITRAYYKYQEQAGYIAKLGVAAAPSYVWGSMIVINDMSESEKAKLVAALTVIRVSTTECIDTISGL